MTTTPGSITASALPVDHSLAAPTPSDAGDTVVFDSRDAADRYYSRASTHADVLARGPFRGHPLTGPVRVRDAAPGDTLVVEIIDMKPGADFGWTAIRPGRGLLPESDFAKPFLQIWDVSDGTHARMGNGIAVPLAPFPGVMGTALDEAGAHSTMPPRKTAATWTSSSSSRAAALSARVGGGRTLQRGRRPRRAG